ncbi:ECF-type riboflavin transporter substrate-binding protein [Streptococcus sp. SGI.013]|uniref:UPF0397 protein ABID28_001258 n=1 Tax=Streptococcus porcorum TaxID=701526 RepID=A0ABV2JFS5_9STRE
MKNNTIKNVVATGIGAALFVVIGILVNIPSPVPNTSIQLQYAVQALFAVIYGPVVGGLVGFIGHMVKDMFSGYGIWWTWVIPSGLLGLAIGLLKQRLSIEKGLFPKKDILTFNVVQIVANLLVWGLIAPIGDILVYQEPSSKVYTQGLVAGLSNATTIAIGGTLLLAVYAKTRTQSGSLSKD